MDNKLNFVFGKNQDYCLDCDDFDFCQGVSFMSKCQVLCPKTQISKNISKNTLKGEFNWK